MIFVGMDNLLEENRNKVTLGTILPAVLQL
jgi:hypothetical protein